MIITAEQLKALLNDTKINTFGIYSGRKITNRSKTSFKN